MPVAAFLPAIIAGGSAIGGALIGKSASDNATEAESDAADKAVALTKDMYEQDRADYAPYRNLGAFSVGELGSLVGMPKDFGTQAVDAATQPRTAVPRPATTPHVSPWTAITDNNPETRPELAPRPEFQSLRDLGAQQQSASSFVRMRAPNGEEEDVDPREVPFFQAQGAMRLS